MKSSTSIVNLSKALLTAQIKMGAASKSAANPFFKSKYADLPSVMEVVKGPLNEAGIVVLQVPQILGMEFGHTSPKNVISTTLIHSESGEWISSETEVVVAKQNSPQDFGAAQTYSRRFGLQAMLFIPAEDDDGETAMGRGYAGKLAYQSQKPASVASTGAKINAAVNAAFDAVMNSSSQTGDTPGATQDTGPATAVTPLKKSKFTSKAAKTQQAESVSVPSTNSNDYPGM